MLKINEQVHALWIGSSLSNIELLTISTFVKHGHTFNLWVYGPISTILPTGVVLCDATQIINANKVFSYRQSSTHGHGKGSYAGFSDIFRYKLLYEKGGWWTDMDVACLRPLDTMSAYFFRSHHVLPVVGNVMKCPAGSLLMKQCYEEAIATVDENNTNWLKPVEILNRCIAEQKLQNYICNNWCNEDKWTETSRYIWHNDKLPEHWHFIHWQNEEWRRNAVTKYDFYYRSALATLLAQYGLYSMPENSFAKSINVVRHSSYFRALENIFLADI